MLVGSPGVAGDREYDAFLHEGDGFIEASQIAFSEGDVKGRVDNAKKALERYTRAVESRTQNLDAVFGQAYALYLKSDYRAAIAKAQYLYERHFEVDGAYLDFVYGASLVYQNFPGNKGFKDGMDALQRYIDAATAGTTSVVYLDAAKAIRSSAAKMIAPNIASPKKAPKPVAVTLATGFGYNDNVTQLGRRFPTPAGVPHKEAWFEESTLALARDFVFATPENLKDEVSLTYLSQVDLFEDFAKRNQWQNTFTARYVHSFTPIFAGGLSLADQVTSIDEALNGNKATGQVFLRYSPVSRLSTQLSYFLIRNDGYVDTLALTNTDGFSHRLELTQDVELLHDRFDLSPVLILKLTYGHQWFDTQGDAARHQYDDLVAKLDWKILHRYDGDKESFIRSITLSLANQWTPDRYSRDAYPAETALDRYNLVQRTNLVSVALKVDMWEDRLTALLSFQHTTRNANVDAKDYDQNAVTFITKLAF